VVPLGAQASAPLQASLGIDRDAAAEWAAQVREERQSFPRGS
jgi:hypothetical protein